MKRCSPFSLNDTWRRWETGAMLSPRYKLETSSRGTRRTRATVVGEGGTRREETFGGPVGWLDKILETRAGGWDTRGTTEALPSRHVIKQPSLG